MDYLSVDMNTYTITLDENIVRIRYKKEQNHYKNDNFELLPHSRESFINDLLWFDRLKAYKPHENGQYEKHIIDTLCANYNVNDEYQREYIKALLNSGYLLSETKKLIHSRTHQDRWLPEKPNNDCDYCRAEICSCDD